MVTSRNALSASAPRLSNGFIQAATPVLVLSAAVLFSTGAHADTVSAKASEANVARNDASFKEAYEAIRGDRKLVSNTREVIHNAVKLIGESEHMIEDHAQKKERELASRAGLEEVGAALKIAKANYEKRAGEEGFIAFDKLNYEQFAAQPGFLDVLEKAIDNEAVVGHLRFGSAIETEASGKLSHEYLSKVIASREKAIEQAHQLADRETGHLVDFAGNPAYLKAEVENFLNPRGIGAETNNNGGWASGDLAQATGENSTAFGVGAVAEGANSTAVGHQAKALQAGATAIGSKAMAVEGATAIGANARASAKGAVAIGEGVVNTEENTVQFAKDGETKRLTNVAAGTNDTDAANVAQLRESATSVTSTLRTEIGESHQRSVKESVAQSNGYTDQRVGEIRKDMAAMDKTFRQGIASSAALMMAAPYVPGKIAATAGTALYRGTGAVAVGVSYWNKAGTWNINGGVSTAGGNSTIVRLGGAIVF